MGSMPQITKKDYELITNALDLVLLFTDKKKAHKQVDKLKKKLQEIVMYQSQIRNNPKAGG